MLSRSGSIESGEIRLSPQGYLLFSELDLPKGSDLDCADVIQLTRLAGQKTTHLTTQLKFWRDVGGLFLSPLCRWPEQEIFAVSMLSAPETDELKVFVDKAPPGEGMEYLSTAILLGLWQRWQQWLEGEMRKFESLAAFLKQWAPAWNRVGRVTLHLAENVAEEEAPFGFMATYASGLGQRGQLQRQPLYEALKEFAGKTQKRELLHLLEPLQKAAKTCELLREFLDEGDIYHPLALEVHEAHHFLKYIPVYEEAGLLVQIPNWWIKRPRSKVKVELDSKTSSKFGSEQLLQFKVQVAMGEEELSEADVKQLLQQETQGLVNLRGKWIEVDRERLQQALDHWEKVKQTSGKEGISFIEGMRMLAGWHGRSQDDDDDYDEWSELVAGRNLRERFQKLHSPETLRGPQPTQLKAQLRPYQLNGLNWLSFCSELGVGACLADDMGLGKTIQILSLLLRYKSKLKKSERRPSLLVAPSSLIENWRDEAQRFAPSLKVAIVHSCEVDREQWAVYEQTGGEDLLRFDLVITSYGMVRRLGWLEQITWHWLVLDEAQAIKTHGSAQTRAVKKLSAQHRIALTGTPIENRLTDLWSLFDFINPGLLGSVREFKEFSKTMSNETGVDYSPLRRLVSPYILRRLKTDPHVAGDLPSKIEMNTSCHLTKRQGVLYQETVKKLEEHLERIEREGGQGAGFRRLGVVLQSLLQFKQICNHPSQFLSDNDYQDQHSGKFIRLSELCEEIACRGERVLVFTQFREIMPALKDLLDRLFGKSGLQLHGGTKVSERKKMVDQFQRVDGPPYFLISLKAGGTGLNLTAANHVIHFDRWWNPAVENQATDRAFRLGQKKNVMVHKFVTRGTLEERIDESIREKQSMADALLNGEEEFNFSKMNNDEILKMVSLNLKEVMG